MSPAAVFIKTTSSRMLLQELQEPRTEQKDNASTLRLDLLVVSREQGNVLPISSLYNLFPYSLQTPTRLKGLLCPMFGPSATAQKP